jgi:hypothetical protein
MKQFAKPGKFGLLLEAEVAPGAQSKFEKRYQKVTGKSISPGKPQCYQNQPNKWGSELRVYFNDPGMAVSLAAHGVHVEYPRKGYMAGKYRYRFNDNKLWWKLVEAHALRLGAN